MWTTDNYLSLSQVIITAIGIGLVFWQIRIAAKALERAADANRQAAESGDMNQLQIVLDIELQLRDCKLQWMQAVNEAGGTPDEHGKKRLDAFCTLYLNTLDRFCHCVRLGLVTESIYRIDYIDRLRLAIEHNPEHFGPASQFQHIQHVHDRWKAEHPADDLRKRRLESRDRGAFR